ncbi:hypothetical protein [Dactylosporangium salmoneum]|uniref:Uncharacterized protein n=1 Tax=Dactylosporangium salmoneum TaxID=53361 RepID=A0ABP5UHV8_9ACTN
MNRLARVPLVLAFAALWGLGAHWLGFGLLDERLPVALGAAFAGGAVVYRVSPGEVRWWPAALVEPRRGVELAARITVPLCAAYVLILALGGALSDLAARRRFRRHMLS